MNPEEHVTYNANEYLNWFISNPLSPAGDETSIARFVALRLEAIMAEVRFDVREER